MSSGRQKFVLIVLIAVVAAAGLGIVGWKFMKRHEALEFTLLFDDAKTLHPGQFVIYNGVRIGEVTSVELGDDRKVAVAVSIQPEHRAKVYQEAVFVIERPSFTDISGERQITMKDTSGAHTTIQQGAMINGSNTLWDEMTKRAKGILSNATQR